MAGGPFKFTVTSPYMLAKTLLDTHYRDLGALTMDLAEILRKQVQSIDAAVIQIFANGLGPVNGHAPSGEPTVGVPTCNSNPAVTVGGVTAPGVGAAVVAVVVGLAAC